MKKVLGIIPARFGSTRFPGKPLVKIAGLPLLEWVYRGAKQSRLISEVIVATDDERIYELCKKIGASVVMTSSELPTGTDRVWSAVSQFSGIDVVINIQGDEPLITGEVVDSLVEPFLEEDGLDMVTLGRTLREEDLNSLSRAKIVLNHRSEALYFSRFPIPFSRESFKERQDFLGQKSLTHIGLYGYTSDFLEKLCSYKPTFLEVSEGLEQLRALYLGARIKVVEVDHDSWGVDTPEDVAKVEEKLRGTGNGSYQDQR